MKSSTKRLFIMAFTFSILALSAIFVLGQEISRSFKDVKSIKIKTVSGDCIIQKGAGSEVKLTLTYTYSDDEFEPEIEQRGSRLNLVERFRSRSWRDNHRGSSQWSLTVPENVIIDFSTASGDLEASDLKNEVEASTASGNVILKQVGGDIRASTASGDIEVLDSDGELKLSTASGRIELTNVSGYAKASTASGSILAETVSGEVGLSTASGTVRAKGLSGELRLSSASGDVDARGVKLTQRSSFSAASGDVEVSLASSPEHDLKISSASGDAILDFNGNKINAFIEMSVREDRGRIRAPFKFDKEEIIYRHDREYMLKTVQKGSGGPTIEIRSASGTAEVKE